jgi:hypothetical protein
VKTVPFCLNEFAKQTLLSRDRKKENRRCAHLTSRRIAPPLCNLPWASEGVSCSKRALFLGSELIMEMNVGALVRSALIMVSRGSLDGERLGYSVRAARDTERCFKRLIHSNT